MAEITKAQLIDKERAAWGELEKRMEFLAELLCAKTDKTLVKDASLKLNDALGKFKTLFKQRIAVEMGPKL